MDIIYTLGPNCLEMPEDMIEAGATGVRLTFSFGTPEIQHERAKRIREAAVSLKRNVKIIADLEGGGARIGLVNGPDKLEFLSLKAGDFVEIISGASSKEVGPIIPIPERRVFDALRVFTKLYIGDGGAVIEVVEIGSKVIGRVQFDCKVEGRRSLSVQNSDAEPVCLTDKDRKSLEHISAFSDDYDSVALSFVGSSADVMEAKFILGDSANKLKLISKIETASGVRNIDEICRHSDVVMVARGDLAFTCDWRELPKNVDAIINGCRVQNVPWIMATQVADGIMHGMMMSRSEICDAWRNIKLGADGFLLSRETAWGPRPVEAVRQLKSLIDYAN